MSVFVRRFRGPLLGFATLIFLAYAVWGGHLPGEPPSMRDFLFILTLFGGPFLVFAYAFWSVSDWSGVAGTRGDRESRRLRIALTGAVLGGSSAALLLLVAPFWDALVMHEGLAKIWILTGMLTAIAAAVCGIGGASKLRVPALVSVMLLPFWLFAAGLLVKAVMD